MREVKGFMMTMKRYVRGGLLLALGVGSGACGRDAEPLVDAGPDAPARPPKVAVPRCADPDEAPTRTGRDAHLCVRRGATSSKVPEWPEVADLPPPVVYVRAGATGGSGTRESPFGDISAALALSPSPSSVALARGTFALSATVGVSSGEVRLRGAGSGGTTLVAPPGMSAVRVEGAATLTLTGVAVRYAAEPTREGPYAVEVTGPRATLRVRDLRVERPARGVGASEGATLCGERVTVTDPRSFGIQLRNGAHGYLRDVVVRGGATTGVMVGRSHLVLEDSLLADNRHDGLALVGAASGGACTSDAGCPSSPACEGFLAGFTHERTCAPGLDARTRARTCASVDVVRGVALLGNSVTGLRAQRARPNADELAADGGAAVFSAPGPTLRAERLVVADTRAPTDGGVGGDGLYIGPGARLTLDTGATLDRDQIGARSEVIQSDRVGVLIDGDRSDDGAVPNSYRAAASVEAQGTRVASNRGPGVFVQQRAAVQRLAFSEVVDNVALGVAVTTNASVATLQDNQFLDTRMGALRLVGVAAPRTLGDGLSVVSTAGGEVLLQDNQFLSNERVGLILAGAGQVTLMGNNQGERNGIGFAGLDGVTVTGPTAAIRGANAPPRDLDCARQSLVNTSNVTP